MSTMLEGTRVEMKYETIASDLIAEIKAGLLQPGDRTPTIRELKVRYGCGYHSIREARLFLKSQLLIEPECKRLVVSSLAPYLV